MNIYKIFNLWGLSFDKQETVKGNEGSWFEEEKSQLIERIFSSDRDHITDVDIIRTCPLSLPPTSFSASLEARKV